MSSEAARAEPELPAVDDRLVAPETRYESHEGARRAKADAIVALLAARGVPLDGAARARILDERDLTRLDRWILRAATCHAIAELWVEP